MPPKRAATRGGGSWKIRTPDCPRCGQPAASLSIFGVLVTPFFCGSEECDVVSWDPTLTLAEIRAATPDIIDLDDIKGDKDK